MNDRRAMRAQDGQAQGMADARGQFSDEGQRDADGVQSLQADQTHLQRKGAKLILGSDAVLADQADIDEADQIGVGLGRAHAGIGSQVA